MAKSAGPTKKAVNQSGVRKSVRNLMSTNAAFKDGREGKGIGGKKMAEGVPRHVSSDLSSEVLEDIDHVLNSSNKLANLITDLDPKISKPSPPKKGD